MAHADADDAEAVDVVFFAGTAEELLTWTRGLLAAAGLSAQDPIPHIDDSDDTREGW